MELETETRVASIANLIEIAKLAVLKAPTDVIALPEERAAARGVSLGEVVAEDFAAILGATLADAKVTGGI